MRKKLLATLLSLAMVLSLLPTWAIAVGEDAVAQIGDTEYATLADAVAAAQNGETITLLQDLSESFTLSVGVSFDTNGKNYTGEVSAPADYVVKKDNNVYTVAEYVLTIKVENKNATEAENNNETAAITALMTGTDFTADMKAFATYAATHQNAYKTHTDKYGIELYGNVTLTDNIVVPSNVGWSSTMSIFIFEDTVIDLNGHTITQTAGTGESGYALFNVKDGHTLTITDSSNNNSGKVSAVMEAFQMYNSNNSKIVITGGTFAADAEKNTTYDTSDPLVFGYYIDSGTLTISGGVFDADPTEYLAEGHTATKVGDVWIVDYVAPTVVVDPEAGEGGKTAEVTTEQTSSVDVTDIPTEVQNAIASVKNEIETATAVTGVELTTASATGSEEVSGLQAVVNKALEDTTKAEAIKTADKIEVKVDVVVTPKAYTADTLKFDLKPVATLVAKDDSGNTTATVENIEVTNGMIDQTQNITVNIFSDFEPKTVLHVADDGETTSYTKGQTPSSSTFTYDTTAKKVTLIVHHFSDVLLYSEEYVAQTGGVMYKTLQDAIDAAENGNTIELLTDVTLTEQVVIPEGKSLTLDLSGKTITGEIFDDDGPDWPSVVLNTGTLTVKDSVGTGKIDGGKAIAVYTYGELTIESGEFIGGEALFPFEGVPVPFWAVLTQGSGSAVIKGGTFVSKSKNANECPVGGNVTVSGGVFSSDPSTYLATGYEAIENSDLWTVQKVVYVAQIGDVEYPTLAEAIAAVPDGTETTITMIGNINLGDAATGVTFPAEKNIALDLNGFTLSGGYSGGSSAQLILNNGTLTIKDSNTNGTGTIVFLGDPAWEYVDGSFDYSGSYAGNTIKNYGALTVEGGNIINNSGGGDKVASAAYAIDTYEAGTVTINGGKLQTAYAAAVRMFYSRGSLTVTGGELVSGKRFAVQDLGGNGDTITINGGIFSSGGETGYSFYTWDSNATASITGGKFDDPIGFHGTGKLTITGGLFAVEEYDDVGDKETYKIADYLATGYECVDSGNTTYPYTVQKKVVNVAQIGSVQYTSLAEAIAAVGDGETITMLQDVDDAVGVKVPSGKNFTIDFNNTIYTVKQPGAGSLYTQTQAFQLLKGSTITFKNGTIQCAVENKNAVNGAALNEKPIKRIIQDYAELTLENMIIDGTNMAHNANEAGYVVSCNYGDVTIKNSRITAVDGDFAFDSYDGVDPTYPGVPTVNVTGNSVINGKVEASGGKINFNGGTVNGMVRVGENKADAGGTYGGMTGSVVNINKGATVNGIVVVFGPQTLNVAGAVNGCIQTNGNAYNGGSTINIEKGAEIVATGDKIDVPVYIPNGTLNVSGGTITGQTAVYFKSTNLNITGGTFVGNGEDAAYQYDGNGCDATGDALVIDSCNYPSGIEAVSVSGGTFTSTNGEPVAAFTKDNTCIPVTKFITGGTFNKAPDADYLAAGYEVITLAEGSKYQVCKKVDGGIKVQVNEEEAQAITNPAVAAEVKAVVAEVIEKAEANAAVNDFNAAAVAGNTEVITTLKITPETLKVTNDETAEPPVVTSITYDVQPIKDTKDEDGTVIDSEEVHELEAPLKFRLSVPAGWENVKVYHEGELKGIYKVLVDEKNNRYVELESSTFSSYTLEQVKNGVVPTDETLVAKVGDNYYTIVSIADAIRAALAAEDGVLELLQSVDIEEPELGFSWCNTGKVLKVRENKEENHIWNFFGESPCVDADAQATYTVTLEVTKLTDKEVINVGDNFTVTPTLSANDVSAIQLKLTYDATRLQFVPADEGWTKTADGTVWYFNYNDLEGNTLPAVTFTALKADTAATRITSAEGYYTRDDSSSFFYDTLANALVDVSIDSIVITAENLPAAVESVYNGGQQSAGITDVADVGYTVTLDAMGTDVDTYSVKLMLANTNGNNKYAWPTDVEGLTVDSTNKDVATYKVFTITPAKVTVIAPTLASGLKYNGQDQGLLAEVASATSTAAAGPYGTFYYAVTDDNTAPTTEGGDTTTATATAVGKHYVWYKFVPDENFYAENANAWLSADFVVIGKGEIEDSWFTLPVAAEGLHADGSKQNVLTTLAEKKAESPVELTFAYFLTTDNTYTDETIADAAAEWKSVSTVADLTAKDAGTYNIWLKVSDGDNYDPCYVNAGTFTMLPGEYRTIVVEGYLRGVTETETTAAVAAKNLVLVFAKENLHFTYGGQAMYDVTGMGYTLYNTAGTEAEPVYALAGTTAQVVDGYSAYVYAYLTSDAKGTAENNVKLTTSMKVAGTISESSAGALDVSGDKKVIVNDAQMVREVTTDGAKNTLVRKNLRADVNRDGKVEVNTDADAIRKHILGITDDGSTPTTN